VETGRVIHKRYLLRRLIQQGQACAVYQGFDQMLQREVAVKVVSAGYTPVYRTAIRATAQFSHPNIVGIYDILTEAETLYIVQEYVDGDDFGTLLQSQLHPYYIVDVGLQICRALIYAGSSSRKVSHGDLTPAAILRDKRGTVRINNFALPKDEHYFALWQPISGNGGIVGGGGYAPGQMTDETRAEDTYATGLLLYQLLAARSPDANVVEPPMDRQLCFMRNVPAEVCEVIARTVIARHPQHISTPEALNAELKTLADTLEVPASAPLFAPAQEQAMPMSPTYRRPQSGLLRGPGRMQESTLAAQDRGNIAAASAVKVDAYPSGPLQGAADNPFTIPDYPQAPQNAFAYDDVPERHTSGVNIPLVLILGIILFVLFFGLGYYLSLLLLKP
jgi:serine/threonine protein kinase